MNIDQQREESLTAVVGLLKDGRHRAAERKCKRFLEASPGCVDHLRLLSHSLLKQNKPRPAEEPLALAISLRPNFAPLHEDLGGVYVALGLRDDAIASMERAVQLDPTRPTAHKKLGQLLAQAGRGEEADEAFETWFEKSPATAEMAIALEHLRTGKLEEAVAIFRKVLKEYPDNVDAMRFLASTYIRMDESLGDAEALLRRAAKIAPDFAPATVTLGALLTQERKYLDAIGVLKEATVRNPRSPEAFAALGSAYSMAGQPEEAAVAYKESIQLAPNMPGSHMSLAHALKTLGNQEEALIAYRRAAELKPDFGETYWSMANLKIFRFEEDEVVEMERQLETGRLTDTSDVHFRFALGKAWEDKKDYDKAWHYYHTGNQKQRGIVKHDPTAREDQDERILEVFTEEFMREHEGNGYDAPDPIFIVSLPRSGSTLVEQILASHSMVEGTAELAELSQIANGVGRFRADGVRFPGSLNDLTPRDWKSFGKEYIDRTRQHRFSDKPIFTDKMPNNFPLLGFAKLILPNAKFINARRHPLDSCLGSYKQLFGKGQNFTYDVMELGLYYEQYDALIKRWHEVMPGQVLDVHYEETVTDLESQVRRILDHCGLPFEEQCLRFYETDRAVKTASSEQVRQPIYTGGLGKWRKYEKHLGEWKDQLGYIIDELPEVVKNAGA